MNKNPLKDIFKTIFSLGLGLLIIWLLYRKTDMKELWQISKSANFVIVFISLLFTLLGNVIRGFRWEIFLRSLGYRPKPISVVYATLGNYAVNYLLPRAGDFWRCAAVTKYDKIPFAKTFETYLIDKFLDIVAVVVVVFLSIVLNIDFFISYIKVNPGFEENIRQIFSSTWLYLSMAAIAVIVVLLFTVFRDTRLMRKVKGVWETIKTDLKLISQIKEKKKVIVYTVLIWLAFYLNFYIGFFAFDFTRDLGLIACFIVFAMSNVGVAVPVQGGIGAWHFMVISSFVILGVGSPEAKSFAFAIFTVQSVWLILCGVFGILALPYVKREDPDLQQNENVIN
jgi:uncharacterized membrane protein YbhN (UPF0104 family)